jgi:hypothetical protein
MDIETISGPKIPDIIQRPVISEEVEPVEEKSRLSHIRGRTSSYENLWDIEDKVTISPEARQKYEQMQTQRD